MKKKGNYILIALSFVVLIGYLVYKEGYQSIVSALKSANLSWLLAAVGLMVIYWLLEAVILHRLTRQFYKKLSFKTTFNTSMLGQFFNCVTPFASGGQPIQAFYMVRSGVPLGVATCGLLAKFLIYQVVLTLYSMVLLVVKLKFFSERIQGFTTLVFIGFIVNFAVMLLLICVGLFKNLSKKLAKGLVSVLAKLRIVKNKEERLAYFYKEIDTFHENFQMLGNHMGTVIESCIVSVVQLTVYFLISYFIYRSFGLNGSVISGFIAAQAFTLMISSFVPLPGAMGGAEMGFVAFFKIFFPGNLIGTAMLLWRLATFYLPIGVGMFFVKNLLKGKDKEKLQTMEV